MKASSGSGLWPTRINMAEVGSRKSEVGDQSTWPRPLAAGWDARVADRVRLSAARRSHHKDTHRFASNAPFIAAGKEISEDAHMQQAVTRLSHNFIPVSPSQLRTPFRTRR